MQKKCFQKVDSLKENASSTDNPRKKRKIDGNWTELHQTQLHQLKGKAW